jgi:hypothetical protein
MRATLILIGGVLASSFGLAIVDAHAAAAWVGAASGVSGALLWLGRMVWTASKTQHTVLIRVEQSANAIADVKRDVGEMRTCVTEHLSHHDEALTDLSTQVAGIAARCEERGKRCPRPQQLGNQHSE